MWDVTYAINKAKLTPQGPPDGFPASYRPNTWYEDVGQKGHRERGNSANDMHFDHDPDSKQSRPDGCYYVGSDTLVRAPFGFVDGLSFFLSVSDECQKQTVYASKTYKVNFPGGNKGDPDIPPPVPVGSVFNPQGVGM